MLEPWNNSSILPSPVNMFLSNKKVDISTLKHVLNNIIKVLSNQSPLHKESALCSRFLYKYDKKFTNDIGYRNFKKVHTALKKYLALNLLRDIENFLCALPSEQNNDKYLPTRQMLEYVTLRIITFSMIMLRVCVCSKQSAIFYLNRIKRGEGHWMSLLPYALLSRLWSMSMVLVQHSTSWYSKLYPFLNVLESKGLQFLPDQYELPQDLEQWLDLKNVDNFGRFHWDQRKLVGLEHNLLEDDDNDLIDSIMNFVNDVNKYCAVELEEELKPIVDKCINQLNCKSPLKTTDYGQVLSRDHFEMKKDETTSRVCSKSNREDKGKSLSRDSFKVLLSAQNRKTKESGMNKSVGLDRTLNNDIAKNAKINENFKHSYMNVTNSDTLKTFILTEEKFRNESDTRSLTAHLSFMQWHALKKAIDKLCDIVTNRKIDKKFQKIWKEKCLNYNI